MIVAIDIMAKYYYGRKRETMQQNINEYWSKYYDQDRDFRVVTSQEISKFLKYVEPKMPKTCLDIGCGTGQLTRELFHRGYSCVGVDASSSAVKIAQSQAVDGLQYIRFDIEQDNLANLPRAPFSLITCKLVYAFIQNKPAFLERAKSLLTPSGVFAVITPLPADVPPEKQGIAVQPKDMKLLETHFKRVVEYKEAGLTYFIGQQQNRP